MPDGAVIDHLYDALARGDVPAARQCLSSDAIIWHGFDQIPLDGDAAARGWDSFVSSFSDRTVGDVRRQETPSGFVQQHLQLATLGQRRMAWPVCIVVDIEDGKITRFAEYMDRAGSFVPSDTETATTPGLSDRID
jgi:ketosteroid isomerase-like protein